MATGKTVVDFVESLKTSHENAVKEAIHEKTVQRKALLEIDELIKEFEKVLVSISYLREVTPRSQDYILSFGERLSTVILCAVLEGDRLKARSFTGGRRE